MFLFTWSPFVQSENRHGLALIQVGNVKLVHLIKRLQKAIGSRQIAALIPLDGRWRQQDFNATQLVILPLFMTRSHNGCQGVLNLVVVRLVVFATRCQWNDKGLVPIVWAQLHLAGGQIDGQAVFGTNFNTRFQLEFNVEATFVSAGKRKTNY